MINPDNTTAHDGRPCALCGNDATGTDVIDNRPIPTCGACHHDQTFECIECGHTFLSETGYRLSNTPDLHCGSCASRYPELIIGREQASRRDISRDDHEPHRRG